MKAAIVGGGEIGQAIKYLIQEGIDISLFDIHPKRGDSSVAECLSDAAYIFVCTPSRAIREVIAHIHTYARKDALVVILSKGMADGKFLFEILDAELQRAYGFLYGPMIAEDMLQGKNAEAVFATTSRREIKVLKRSLQIQNSVDVRGVSIMGVLKNVYAIYIGFTNDERNIQHALREAAVILKDMGGDTATVMGPSGAGDLIATATSIHSKNRQYGIDMRKTGSSSLDAEGALALAEMKTRGGMDRYPILKSLL
tara:strand:+ start:4242 stop:5006 length:765 start_codon:yes stop_codon:yes gene_type:complete